MLVEFIATVMASIGQFLDARTTQVVLNAKFGRERNFVSRFIIERFGFTGYYIIKVVIIPITGLMLHSTSTLFCIGAIGLGCAVWNYRLKCF